jgi:low affinity Fe/Cu permease
MQLISNTATTTVTFLMDAVLQNAQTRADEPTQHKLNALAQGRGWRPSCTTPSPRMTPD